MNSQKGIVGCLLLACTLQMPAQVKTYKYRVNFRDKAETTYTLDNPRLICPNVLWSVA